jgi:hypothetical protein
MAARKEAERARLEAERAAHERAKAAKGPAGAKGAGPVRYAWVGSSRGRANRRKFRFVWPPVRGGQMRLRDTRARQLSRCLQLTTLPSVPRCQPQRSNPLQSHSERRFVESFLGR